MINNVDLTHKPLLKTQALIAGAWHESAKTFPVTNPANGETLAHVTDCGADETYRAIASAKEAFPAWSGLLAKDRAAILHRWATLILEHIEDLAIILNAEQGKPVGEARAEILGGAAYLEWYAGEAVRVYGDLIPSPFKGARVLVQKQAVGVCAMITPWNFPSSMIVRKVGAALAAGCPCILKPAEETPLSALALGALAMEAGVPAGVFNILPTSDPARLGKILCESADVRKLSFTGSTAVGKILYAQCAGTVKKLSLELGGNAPFIVFEDADLDSAVQGALASKYRNAGQTCICANRMYVQESVYAAFSEKFVAAVKGVQSQPLINAEAVEKVQALVADALEGGAVCALGGTAQGQVVAPTVLTHVHSGMRLAQEEIFGPVAPLFSFKDEADVIAQANDTAYGLAAYFYARDVGRVWRVAEALEYGMVAVNSGALTTEVAPFGGVKESGIGREGSKYGLEEYVEMKYILMGGVS